MFRQVRVQGLGPLADHTFDLDPAGIMEISGPSESGKSTLVEAVCLALWGVSSDGRPFPVEAIRESQASVTATTARGTVLVRRLSRSRQQARELHMGEQTQVFSREEDLAARLGPVGQRAELGRLVLAPFAWVPLLQRELGRPLRDLLLSALPGGDLRAEVAELMGEHELRQTDPLDAAGAAKLQTATNRGRDEARGRLSAAESRSRRTNTVREPDAGEVEAARGVVRADQLWATHDQERKLHDERDALRSRAVESRDAWRQRRQELGEKPEGDTQGLRAAGEKVKRLERELTEERRLHQADLLTARDVSHALEQARKRYADLRAAGDACPTCERPGWAKASERLTEAEAHGKTLAEQQERAARAAEVRGVRVQDLEQELQQARQTLSAADQALAAPRAWEERMRTLGPEPQVPVPVKAPAAPEASRPSQDQVEAAKAAVRQAVEAEGARKRAEQEETAASRELRDSRAAWERSDAEAKRVEALVSACRRAPSEIARRQAEALGDLGPVRIVFPEKANKAIPEVEVLVDERPYWLASTGRQVVADLHLRAVIRRISGLHALPIAVDRAQDWSGEWPAVPGPVWFLRTALGEITVRRIG